MKICALSIIAILLVSNAAILFVIPAFADENQPQWPTNWILADIDTIENSEKAFRDVHFAYYSLNDNYLYFKLECYGYPNFSAHPDDSRYKWFIDVDDPYNMVWSGGNVVEADYMLFIEDTNNDGTGDIYLINDIDGDGSFNEWEPPNNWYGSLITDVNISNYSIFNKNISLWIKLENISNPNYLYFTWSTDNENSNINQAPTNDRSNTFSADLSKADISIEKSDIIDPVQSGGYLSYILNVENHGPHVSVNMNVTDDLPSEVSFVNAFPTPDGFNNSIYYWNFAFLDVDESIQIIINVSVNSGFVGTLTNIAHVYNDTRDPIPGNNEDIEQTDVIYIADLSITKSVSEDTIYPGEYIEYTLNVINNGPNAATNVNVKDNLPDKVTFNSAIPTPSGVSGSIYWWDYSSLGLGGSKQIKINVSINNDATGTIINSANVTSDTYDPSTGNNDDTTQVSIGNVADLIITKTANTNFVYVGDYIIYTINVTNNGPDIAENIIVYDSLSNDVTFNFADPTPSGNIDSVYWWYYSSLGVDESKIITINVTVNFVPEETINNIANVTSDRYDSNPGNSEDNEQIDMGKSADLSLIKTANPKIVTPGSKLKYTIVVTNNGPDGVENVSVTDTLPNKVTFSSSNPDFSGNSSSTYWWNFSYLGVNETKIIIINVTVNKNASGKITNTANVTSDTHDPNPGDDSNKDDEQTDISQPSSGGGGGGGGGVKSLPPTADPNGPYFGFKDEEVEFDGTGSFDNDEDGLSIVQYDWKFFDDDDWHLNIGVLPIFFYYEIGIYNITLRVIDDEGSSSVSTTIATIYQANLPPILTINNITGVVKGHQNISYPYGMHAFDPDGDNITYTVIWGDGSYDISNPIANEMTYTVDHMWAAPGHYVITVYATDEQNAQSEKAYFSVLIDILYVKDIGYLIDYNSDGTYEKFFSNKTRKETDTEKLDDRRYLINDDDDDKWEWIYNPDTDTLEVYYHGEETDLTLWYILLILILLCLIAILLIIYKKKKKKETPMETSTQTHQP